MLICWGRSSLLASAGEDIQLPVSYTSFYRCTASAACWETYGGYAQQNWCACGYKDLSTVHCSTRYPANVGVVNDYVQYITIGI